MIMRQNRLLYISQKSTIIEHMRKSWKNHGKIYILQ